MQDTPLLPPILQDPHHLIIVLLLMRKTTVNAAFPSLSVLLLPIRISRTVGYVVQGTEAEKAVHLRNPLMTGIILTFAVFKKSAAHHPPSLSVRIHRIPSSIAP